MRDVRKWVGGFTNAFPGEILVITTDKSVFNGAVPHYVLSGKLSAEKFNTVHARFVLDQPTIGKWLFWFSVMAMSSLPYAFAVGWLADRKTQSGELAFGIGASVLAVFLLCNRKLAAILADPVWVVDGVYAKSGFWLVLCGRFQPPF